MAVSNQGRLKVRHYQPLKNLEIRTIFSEDILMTKLILIALFISLNVHARDWETVYIPEAKCGDGLPYKVFVRPGKKSKLAIEFMGGGACWSLATCWGPKLHTWIHPIPSLPAFSYLTANESPIKDHTFLYFPYCNGDVYAGNHIANYMPLKNTYHEGSKNVMLTFEHLRRINKIEFRKADSLILFGSSAGGIGALLHRSRIDGFFKPNAKKLLIADSVGLHYADDFWGKFTPEQMSDFKHEFSIAGVNVTGKEGMIAPQMRNYCDAATGWKIGFIQTTKDLIMSKMFGGLSEEEHRKAVLGPSGIRKSLTNSKNCSTHISEGIGHMLLIFTSVAEDSLDIESGESAKDYVDRLIKESVSGSL